MKSQEKMDFNPSQLGEYKIVSALDQQMVLDCVMDQNNLLTLWKWHQGNNQRWNIQDLGNGKFTIFNVMNSKVMSSPIDVHKDGWFIKCTVSKKMQNQIWQMIPCIDEKFTKQNAFFIKNSKSGKVLDVQQGKAKNGQSIIQWEIKKDEKIKTKLNQIWLIEPVTFIPEKKSFYKIFSAADYNLVLDASKGESNLNSLILYSCHKGDNQKFSIETMKGKYMLINKDKKLSMTVEGQQKGAKVRLAISKREENQLWQLIPCRQKQLQGKHAFYIKSIYSMYLDTTNGKANNGTDIVQNEFTGNQTQIWMMHKI